MSLSIGIVGLPNVGKSTLFNALTNNNILAANYPFATIEPNTGIVPIPDERLTKLADLYSSGTAGLDGVQGSKENRANRIGNTESEARTQLTQQPAKSDSGVAGSAGKQAGAASRPPVVPATVTFVDIAGLVAGASQGEGLGNKFLSHIRSCNAIVQVVRAFEDGNVVHVDNKVEPQHDIDVITTELVLADLQTVEKRLAKFEKEVRTNPKLAPVLNTIKRVQKLLNEGQPVHAAQDIDIDHIADLQLITAKPTIYLFNLSEQDLSNNDKKNSLKSLVAPSTALFVSAQLEAELNGLDEDDRQELLASYGQDESGLVQLIHAAYDTLGLQSYLTAGEKEVRAWTIKQGSTAPQAAGVIHGDFERGFIAADVVSYPDLIAAGSWPAARAAGKVRTEGKTYVMQPDDVVEFKFNV